MKNFEKNDVQAILRAAIFILEKNKIKNAKLSCATLLSYVLKIKKNDLYLYFDKIVLKEEETIFKALIQRRAKNEPLEYIIGKVDFYGCTLFVDRNVLIPRVETEILVDLIAKKLRQENLKNKILFDVCTGSGAIGIALKKKFPSLKVFVSDISEEALKVAKKNAKTNGVNIFFKRGDLLAAFRNLKADFIVSNPPYVSEKEFEGLDEDVKNFEPKISLIAKDEGLEFYKKIEKEIFNFSKPKAKLFFEIGYKQKRQVLKIFSSKKYVLKEVIKDFSKKDRFFFVEIE